ncbi:MAG: hypothetical protein RIQ52_747 [Pseudomonadota bacterium]
MSGSLRDQLLKAGLVSEKKAKQAVREQRKDDRRAQGQNQVTEAEQIRQKLQQQQAEKQEQDRLRNLELQRQREKQAVQVEIRQLVLQHRVQKGHADMAYNFQHKGKVKRIYVSDAQRAALVFGDLVIVYSERDYELLPASTGEKISARDPDAVIVSARESVAKDQEAVAEDPYAAYVVPDDLVW